MKTLIGYSKAAYPDEDYGYAKFMATVDALVIDRNSYEKALTFEPWPYEEKRVIVLSKTLVSVKNNAELFKGNIKQLAEKLYAEGIKHVYVDGGMTACHFLNEKMIDQMTLSVIPIILGAGIPLFSHIDTELACHLISSQSCGVRILSSGCNGLENKPHDLVNLIDPVFNTDG